MHAKERRRKILLEKELKDLITLAVSSNNTRKTVMMTVLFLSKKSVS